VNVPSLFSIITPVYAPPMRALVKCVESVLAQRFGDWEWCVVDDASPDPAVPERLRELASRDPRVRLDERSENGGIVAASNDALALASGTFVAFLDHDDELEPDALLAMAELIESEPDLDYAYSDEWVWSAGDRRFVRMFKPGWSPERLRAQNYANHLSVMRRSLVVEVGGFREGFDGAQDHDLVLRVGERARVVRHLPKPLYRWKASPGSTVGDPEAKEYAFEAGVRAVREHCERVGIDAEVEHGPSKGIYRVRRHLVEEPLVSVVIPTNAPTLLIDGVEHDLVCDVVRDLVERTDYSNIEILIVPDPQTARPPLVAAREIAPGKVRILDPVPRPFSFSRKSNVGAAYARGEFLLFLNDDVKVHEADWLGSLVAIAREPGVGAVGPMLLFPDGTIQHAGVFAWHGPGHIGFGAPAGDLGPWGMYAANREVLATTGACLLSPARVFDEVGGFTLQLPGNWNDVDYCLKLADAGYRVVWTPQAVLTHYESATRDPEVLHLERISLWGRWYRQLVNDPYFTPSILPVGVSWPMEPHR
jgi:GT2 family glycosyltransferase